VDYYLPGCPTTPELIADAVAAIVEGKLPDKGAVLADSRALCDTCSRRDSKPERLTISEFKRVYERNWILNAVSWNKDDLFGAGDKRRL